MISSLKILPNYGLSGWVPYKIPMWGLIRNDSA
jgi:hypothetical protein